MENTQGTPMTELRMRIQREDNLNDVYYEDKIGPGNGRHHYIVARKDEDKGDSAILADIQFQNGPRNDPNSTHGVLEADLLEIVRHRLQCFNEGEFRTRENACALTHIEEALMWLNKRKDDRKERQVLGTYNK